MALISAVYMRQMSSASPWALVDSVQKREAAKTVLPFALMVVALLKVTRLRM